MSEPKLYRATVEYEVFVMAESESEATLEAERAARDVEPRVNARPVTPTELRWMPKCEKESVPGNSEDDRTVEEILGGAPTATEGS